MSDWIKDLGFRFMAFGFKFRDLVKPPGRFLAEAGVRQGFHVLDFGCGPGSYSMAAAKMAGESGKVYALDVLPVAIRTVAKAARKKGLENVHTILSDCDTGLDENSVDLALIYDVFHHLESPSRVLSEVSRVLKPGAILSFSDHHMKESDIVSALTREDLFELSNKQKYTFSFRASETN